MPPGLWETSSCTHTACSTSASSGGGKLHLPAPGTYLVEWLVELRSLEGLRIIPVPQTTPLRIQVGEGTVPQTFCVELFPADLAAVVK